MEDIVFMVFSGLSMILVLLPIKSHLKAVNVGTLSLIFYVFFGNLFYFINSFVWYGKMGDPAPLWCDITAKFQIGMSVGIPASCLCINRRLYLIATMQLPNGSAIRRLAWQELIITAGLPSLVMVLHYVVQGHRYLIIQGVGCWADTYWSWAAVWLVLQWPFSIGLTSLGYAIPAYLSFRRSHREWTEILKNKALHMTKSRYIRLMALSCGEVCFTLPLGFCVFVLSVSETGINPWISWAYVHYDWYTIPYVDDFFLTVEPLEWVLTELGRWCLPISAIAFFAFFGLSGGMLQECKDFFRWLFGALHLSVIKEKDVEVPETYSQFADRFVVDYVPSESRKAEEEGETPLSPPPRRLQTYVDTIPNAQSADTELSEKEKPESDAIAPAIEGQSVTSAREEQMADSAVAASSPSHICCTCHLDRHGAVDPPRAITRTLLPPPYSDDNSASVRQSF